MLASVKQGDPQRRDTFYIPSSPLLLEHFTIGQKYVRDRCVAAFLQLECLARTSGRAHLCLALGINHVHDFTPTHHHIRKKRRLASSGKRQGSGRVGAARRSQRSQPDVPWNVVRVFSKRADLSWVDDVSGRPRYRPSQRQRPQTVRHVVAASRLAERQPFQPCTAAFPHQRSPPRYTATSRRFFNTSRLTAMISMLASWLVGLRRLRPEQLFEFN